MLVRPCREGGCFSPTSSDETSGKFTPGLDFSCRCPRPSFRRGPVASSGVAEHRVLMYSRRACHLCDEARAVLLAERERSSFAFEEIFIDGDDRLEHER